MIVISHHEKDKALVQPIAERLSEFFGSKRIFLDVWSNKPGEKITTEMDGEQDETSYFFYFITKNSLDTEMIEPEWISEIEEKMGENTDFIAIQSEDITTPEIIPTTNYLNLATDDLETILSKMIEMINEHQDTDNLQGYVVTHNRDNFSFYVVAQQFFEPLSTFLILTDYEEDEVEIEIANAPTSINHFYSDMKVLDYGAVDEPAKLNGFLIGVPGGVSKDSPIEITIKRIKGQGNFIDLHHVKSNEELPKIQLEFIDDVSQIKK